MSVKSSLGKSGVAFVAPVYGQEAVSVVDPVSLIVSDENSCCSLSGSELPDQSGNAGKVLGTDGSNASWVVLNELESPSLSGSFTAIDDLGLTVAVESNTLTFTGDSGRVWPILSRNGELSVISGTWGYDANVKAGDSVKLRTTSAGTGLTAKTVTLYAHGINWPWTVTTSDVAPAEGYTGWWQAGTGVWSDNGTTPATTDGLVYRWDDSSGNNHHFIQSNASLRPINRVAVLNGNGGLEFDGANDLMNCGAWQDNTCTLVILGKFLSGTFPPRLGGYGQGRSLYGNNGSWGFYQSGVGSSIWSGDNTQPTIHVLRLQTGVGHMARRNGANAATITCSQSPSTTLGIGSNGSALEYGNVHVYEVLHYPFILSDVEAAKCEEYLNYKFQIY